MKAPLVNLSFPCTWDAEILTARPVILPARHFVYPNAVDEVERGALEVMVRPASAGTHFLATCALGFRDAAVPTGIWSAPNASQLCAVSGGYAYMIDTVAPEKFTMLPYRPVLGVVPDPVDGLLLFIGHRAILAWGSQGEAWQSPKLSDEGIAIHEIRSSVLSGTGWNMISDQEVPFRLELRSGRLMQP